MAPGAVAAALVEVACTYPTGSEAVTGLAGVDLALFDGQLCAVVGPSGSGKSTLVRCLAGLQAPQRGRVEIGGIDLASLDERARTVLRRRHLGVVLQHGGLHPGFTVRENILLPLTLDHQRVDPAWLDTVVGTLGLGDRLHHRPSELSGGQRTKVALARAIIHRPRVLLADEPTGNLDRSTGAEVLALLHQLAEGHGLCVLVVTHDLRLAAGAPRAVVLRDGLIVADLVPPSWDELAAWAAPLPEVADAVR